MPWDDIDYAGGGTTWDDPNFAGTTNSDPEVAKVDQRIDGKFTGIAPPAPGDDAILNQMKRQTAASRAPTGTANIGTTILDSITGAVSTIAKTGIQNLAGKITAAAGQQTVRQGATGRPITDPQSSGNAPSVNILGVPLPLKQGQIDKIQAGQAFSLTPNQLKFLSSLGVNIAGKNLMLTGSGQVVNSKGKPLNLSAQTAGAGAGGDNTTTVLYFALAAGALVLFLYMK